MEVHLAGRTWEILNIVDAVAAGDGRRGYRKCLGAECRRKVGNMVVGEHFVDCKKDVEKRKEVGPRRKVRKEHLHKRTVEDSEHELVHRMKGYGFHRTVNVVGVADMMIGVRSVGLVDYAACLPILKVGTR
jgi:hypothetical protein